MAAAIPGVDDAEVLQSRRLYASQGRTDGHDALVARLKQAGKEFLNSFPAWMSPSSNRSADKGALD